MEQKNDQLIQLHNRKYLLKFYHPFYRDKKKATSSSDIFDYVIVANGHFSVPFIPEYPGMKAFPGRIMHSHDFRDAEEFRDKNVVILGSSYSAEDVFDYVVVSTGHFSVHSFQNIQE